MRDIRGELSELQRACRACTRCADQGIIAEARPTLEGTAAARFFLVGQAPGPIEFHTQRPFDGRAGKELTRWMLRAGFESEQEFRQTTYIAAVMRCFPGRSPHGGDLRPSARAIANCRPWLDAELELLKPSVIIAVGQLAIERFLGRGNLEERVGKSYGRDPVVLPLPHPSGQSRWLNKLENRVRLEAALGLLSDLRHALR